ncbi:hypothetical protein JHK85_048629 [Glycine max]|nr:hypothetical protein JHK85_048629 [Glycine max]
MAIRKTLGTETFLGKPLDTKSHPRNWIPTYPPLTTVKRPLPPSASDDDIEDKKMKKKVKPVENNDDVERVEWLARFDDNLLFEVLKHVDVRTLTMSGCVNKQ